MRRITSVVVTAIVAVGCAGSASSTHPTHTPRSRTVVITTVPLLVKELAKTYPFLGKDFAPGGVLSGKEVYAFSPSTITVMAGDTLHLSLINPEDDDHAFVLRDLFVKLAPQSKTDTTYVAGAPGIYDFSCSVPAHVPMMHGQLVVLSAEPAPRD